jgi:hypothetical protein
MQETTGTLVAGSHGTVHAPGRQLKLFSPTNRKTKKDVFVLPAINSPSRFDDSLVLNGIDWISVSCDFILHQSRIINI